MAAVVARVLDRGRLGGRLLSETSKYVLYGHYGDLRSRHVDLISKFGRHWASGAGL